MKKAIAYVSDVILGRTGEVIGRAHQKELIQRHAKDNDIEIVAWFEDEMYSEDVMTRSGVEALLAYKEQYDLVLVERVWSLSRDMKVLEPFMAAVERNGAKVESATYMWDCVSQMCRRRFDASLPSLKPTRPVVTREEAGPVRVRKPEKLNFVVTK